jgi:hypothetical protein
VEKSKQHMVGGSGQTYFSVSFGGMAHRAFGAFLGLADPGRILTERPPVDIEAAALHDPSLSDVLRFRRRYEDLTKSDRYQIATQNRQTQSRHPGWTRDAGFPEAPDDVTGKDDPRMPDVSGVRLVVLRDGEGGYHAGFVDRPLTGPLAAAAEILDPDRAVGVLDLAATPVDLDAFRSFAAERAAVGTSGVAPEVQGLIDVAERVAGRRGFGRRASYEERRAIELRAEDVAEERLDELGWHVARVGDHESWDLTCTREGAAQELHVEVKGTTGDGGSVALTRNEVVHAREHGHVALAVVSGIRLEVGADGAPAASGGTLDLVDPWEIDAHGELIPVAYEYRRRRA